MGLRYSTGKCSECGLEKIITKNLPSGKYCVMCNIERLEKKKDKTKSQSKKKLLLEYYRKAWDNSPKVCEECGVVLKGYSATFVSHILARGSHPELALHPLNHNILCYEHHHQWEFSDRTKMKIFNKNQLTINKLKTQ